MLKTPVLFMIFNRPDVTQQVFAEIRKAKPKQLFIAADGAREHKAGEKEKCEETRKIVVDNIDWDCEVKTLFREKNLGCKYAVSGAISWFFDNVEEGIILEDDCVPHQSFFNFCGELLEKYRDNQKVMHIGSNYFNQHKTNITDSYYFSHYIEIWGWATWRRAWELYDPEMKNFGEMRKKDFLKDVFKTADEKEYWVKCFDTALEKNIDTWDYQWVYCICANKGVVITPYTNLVSNVGFREDATHTTLLNEVFSNVKAHSISEIKHPKKIEIAYDEDKLTFKRTHQKQEHFLKSIAKRVTPRFVVNTVRKLRSNK